MRLPKIMNTGCGLVCRTVFTDWGWMDKHWRQSRLLQFTAESTGFLKTAEGTDGSGPAPPGYFALQATKSLPIRRRMA